MASQSRKHRGYATQRLVAGWFEARGWPAAHAVGAGESGSDVRGMPGIDVEVKARRGLDLNALLRQLIDRRAETTELCFGVVRPDGYGEANLECWPVVMDLESFTLLLTRAGYAPEVQA